MSVETKLSELNLHLPPTPAPGGVYKPMVIVGNLAYLSGHGPTQDDLSLILGRIGEDLDAEAGYLAARQTGLAMLATLKNGLGSLDRVKRVVKLLGLVNSAPDFYKHPAVINGCSELFAELYGKKNGIGTRSAFGVAALPGGMAVEIEGIFEIE
ncbi:MAG: RidA family protein [Verrucomicrobiae bacterium]|nr:RidA family protein [Verrucomicrobiae bacterium]